MNDNTGISILAGTRGELGAFAHELTEWRTARYLEAGFYDENVVASLVAAGLPIESSRADDYEIVAIDRAGNILATLSLRSPATTAGRDAADANRPMLSLEAVHGRAFIDQLSPTPLATIWEAGRFLRDRRMSSSAAVVAVTTEAARLVAHLAATGRAAFVVGEVEPTVALRHLHAFGLPMRIGNEATAPQIEGLLACRYVGRTVVPFALDVRNIKGADLSRWRRMAMQDHLLEGRAHASA